MSACGLSGNLPSSCAFACCWPVRCCCRHVASQNPGPRSKESYVFGLHLQLIPVARRAHQGFQYLDPALHALCSWLQQNVRRKLESLVTGSGGTVLARFRMPGRALMAPGVDGAVVGAIKLFASACCRSCFGFSERCVGVSWF